MLDPAPVSKIQKGLKPAIFKLSRIFGAQKKQPQWTDRLASLASKEALPSTELTLVDPQQEARTERYMPLRYSKEVAVSLRLEGPYFTPADPARYQTVVCLVAGTGVSGALAIVNSFKELERQCASEDGSCSGPKARCSIAPPQREVKEMRQGRGSIISARGTTRKWTRCVVIWSVREDSFVNLDGLDGKFPSRIRWKGFD